MKKQHHLSYLGQEAVDEDRLGLAEAVHSEDTLDVVGGVPGRVEDDDPVGGDQVDAQGAGPCGDEEQTTSVGPEGREEEERVRITLVSQSRINIESTTADKPKSDGVILFHSLHMFWTDHVAGGVMCKHVICQQ